MIWKMREDLSGPYPGFGLGALDPFHGYVVYRLLDEEGLAAGDPGHAGAGSSDCTGTCEITQDLGLGMMLWMTHFFPGRPGRASCASVRSRRSTGCGSIRPGYFCREPGLRDVRFAFTNYGVSVGPPGGRGSCPIACGS